MEEHHPCSVLVVAVSHNLAICFRVFLLAGLYAVYSRNSVTASPNTDPRSSSKIQLLVRECLDCLASILEFSLASSNVGKNTEELLGYLKTLMSMDPLASLSTVQCLLRCIFKMNSANSLHRPQYGSGQVFHHHEQGQAYFGAETFLDSKSTVVAKNRSYSYA